MKEIALCYCVLRNCRVCYSESMNIYSDVQYFQVFKTYLEKSDIREFFEGKEIFFAHLTELLASMNSCCGHCGNAHSVTQEEDHIFRFV